MSAAFACRIKVVSAVVAAALLGAVYGTAAARDGDFDFSYAFYGFSLHALPGGMPIGVLFNDAALQPDGKLLLAAPTLPASGDSDFSVLRLMADGSVDSGFGNNGAATVAFNRAGGSLVDAATGITLQQDGKIVVVGLVDGDAATGPDMGIVRLDSQGKPDDTFGNGGKAIVPFNLGDCSAGGCLDLAYRVAQQSDGKLLVVGVAQNGATTGRMALARLTVSGQRDSTFDGDGRVTFDFGGDLAYGLRVRQLADQQHIVAVGVANTAPGSANTDFALVKLDQFGQLDPNFGVGGKATYAFDVGGNLVDGATDFAELPDGRLLVCGTAVVNAPENGDFACVRFTADGKPDPTFTPTLVPFDLGGNLNDAGYAFAFDRFGRVVVAGRAARADKNDDFGVIRLLPDGALDDSFGNSGFVHVGDAPLFGTDYDNAATAIAIQPDGQILVAGYATYDAAGDSEFEVVRLHGDDTVFFAKFDRD